MNIRTDLDIRDIQPGQTYYVLASAQNGGRCVLNGMFIAAWESKEAAKVAANGNNDLTVVKSRKPE